MSGNISYGFERYLLVFGNPSMGHDNPGLLDTCKDNLPGVEINFRGFRLTVICLDSTSQAWLQRETEWRKQEDKRD